MAYKRGGAREGRDGQSDQIKKIRPLYYNLYPPITLINWSYFFDLKPLYPFSGFGSLNKLGPLEPDLKIPNLVPAYTPQDQFTKVSTPYNNIKGYFLLTNWGTAVLHLHASFGKKMPASRAQ